MGLELSIFAQMCLRLYIEADTKVGLELHIHCGTDLLMNLFGNCYTNGPAHAHAHTHAQAYAHAHTRAHAHALLYEI